MQWALQDHPLGTPAHYVKPTIESWFGLVRLDGSFKPSAIDFRDSYPASPLPSTTFTNIPLIRGNGAPGPYSYVQYAACVYKQLDAARFLLLAGTSLVAISRTRWK